MIKYNDWDTTNSKEYYKNINKNNGKYQMDDDFEKNFNENLEKIRKK